MTLVIEDFFESTVVELIQGAFDSHFDISGACLLLSFSDDSSHGVFLFNLIEPWVLRSEKVTEDFERVSHKNVTGLLLSSILKAIKTVLIEDGTSVSVRKNLICLGNTSEHCSEISSFLSWVSKWVQLQGKLSISLSNLLCIGQIGRAHV